MRASCHLVTGIRRSRQDCSRFIYVDHCIAVGLYRCTVWCGTVISRYPKLVQKGTSAIHMECRAETVTSMPTSARKTFQLYQVFYTMLLLQLAQPCAISVVSILLVANLLMNTAHRVIINELVPLGWCFQTAPTQTTEQRACFQLLLIRLNKLMQQIYEGEQCWKAQEVREVSRTSY